MDNNEFTQDTFNAIVYALWEQELEEMDNAERLRVRDHFAEIAGVDKTSPLALSYMLFWAGVVKGTELMTCIDGMRPTAEK